MSCRMGRFTHFMYVHTSVCLSPPLGHPARPDAQPVRPEAQRARPEAQPGKGTADHLMPLGYLFWLAGWLGLRSGWLGLRPGWLGLRPGWMAQRGGQTDERTDEQTNGQMENLPILQDFVPYRGRCPKRIRMICNVMTVLIWTHGPVSRSILSRFLE